MVSILLGLFSVLTMLQQTTVEQQSEWVIWSHRCKSERWGDNDLRGCIDAAQEFPGIEIDLQWAQNKFWLHHDSASLATSTLDDLLSLELGVDIWIDLKSTHDMERMVKGLLLVLEDYSTKHHVVVEVYDKYLVALLRIGDRDRKVTIAAPFTGADIRTMNGAMYLGWPIWIEFLSSPVYSWGLGSGCSIDYFFDSGGVLYLTDEMRIPDKCRGFYPSLGAAAMTQVYWCVALILGIVCFLRNRRDCELVKGIRSEELKLICVYQKSRPHEGSIMNEPNWRHWF